MRAIAIDRGLWHRLAPEMAGQEGASVMDLWTSASVVVAAARFRSGNSATPTLFVAIRLRPTAIWKSSWGLLLVRAAVLPGAVTVTEAADRLRLRGLVGAS